MRITNKIMQRNNLSNINTNKMYQDKLSTQMSTQKKINRPSEDPVVAIRSLRLRSNVTEITQYYSKNIPDAESWIKITEDALSKLTDVLSNMIGQCTRGTNNPFTTEDRGIVLEQLKLLGEEVYATGDADYAGRYVFTGYRTDTPLSFQSERKQKYTITEQLDKNAIDSVISVNTGKVLDINSANYDTINNGTANTPITEDDISSVEVHRIRLAYNNCLDAKDGNNNDLVPTISFVDKANADGTINTIVWAGGDSMNPPPTHKIKKMNSFETNPDPYTYIAQNEEKIVYVPETGELLFGKKRYEELMALKDSESTANVNEGEIRITYEKENWQKGDLRPEHYFYCKADKVDDLGNLVMGADGKTPERIEYNDTYITTDIERQVIEYDVGFNQSVRINSRADECFNHGIGREVDDMVNAMQNVLDLEGAVADIEAIMAKLDEGQTDKMGILQDQLDAANKALTYAKEKEQKMFEGAITAFQNYLDETNLCVTACGSRGSKLDLVKNRSQNQKTTYETLKSENEDIDITEVAIQLNSAELTYDAALMAAGKVMKTTLLDFI